MREELLVEVTTEEVAAKSTDQAETTLNITEEVGEHIDEEIVLDSSQNVGGK